ncbi:rhomboid family intramembrane serine protease [Mariprofundus erugo]|uniref:rhomboid family intramembrane serine protease n=1 Tax=Mariprofundus erugo TaxID=2528639 RepID=UPI0010FEFE97|nr:rhomboid family intramembrane serine protease [Mariprofundus erugo]TLS78236.1 rhomboid family intramembrane serine protease [Mariprofundus erugo]
MFLFPIEKDNPTRNPVIWVWLLLAANCFVFLVTQYALDWDSVVAAAAFVPAEPTLATLFTSMFLHAGWMHLLGNMFFLWMFADNVEDVLGRWLFLPAYLFCGVAATGLHMLLDPGATVPLVGASGAISGMLGLYIVLYRYAQVDLLVAVRYSSYTFHMTALGAGLAWLGEQALLGAFASAGVSSGVAFWAHVGGLLAGMLIGLLCRLTGRVAPKPERALRIERDKLENIWCPYCGTKDVIAEFGLHVCSCCGIEYDIVVDTEHKA